MQNNIAKNLAHIFPGIEVNKPLSALCTMGIGGPADYFYKLTKTEELPNLLSLARELQIPYLIVGGGSNLIFADEGFRGLVIQMQAKKMEQQPEEAINENGLKKTKSGGSELHVQLPEFQNISVEAGAPLSQVIQFTLKNNLTGLEKLMGIPGTIGGAVRGNAGAYGTEIKDFVTGAEIYSPTALTSKVGSTSKVQLSFSYRHSSLKTSNDILLKVFLKLPVATPEQAKAALAEALEIVKTRVSKQPKGKCSGSFFKNPSGASIVTAQNPKELKAGYLLEKSGCSGLKQGDAQVSPQHANWVMNLGHATQKDVLILKEEMQKRVYNQFKITLEPEVQLFNATGPIAPTVEPNNAPIAHPVVDPAVAVAATNKN